MCAVATVNVIYIGPGPTADEPGLVVTDEPCPSCRWPETIVHAFLDGRVLLGCAGCEVEREPLGREEVCQRQTTT